MRTLLMAAALQCDFVLTTASSPNNWCCCERVCRFLRSVRGAWQRLAMLALCVAVVVVTLHVLSRMICCEMLSLQHLLVTRPHHIEKEGFQMRWGLVGLEALLHSQL